MYSLALESSCDDTSIAIFKDENLISMKTASQNEIHSLYGGIVPELAARAHTKNILPLYKESLKDANITLRDISLISATYAPGLVGSLLVGLEFAKSLAIINNIPFKKVHHIAAHLHSAHLTNDIKYPYLGIVVSGGHSTIYIVRDLDDFELVSYSLDDAIGESYDKVAKMCNLGYPGGPIIDKISKNYNGEYINFPRPMKSPNKPNLSFSGLKTAVNNYIKENPNYNLDQVVSSFQEAAIDALAYKIKLAAKNYNMNRIVVTGGVSANSRLRSEMFKIFKNKSVYFPELKFCMDNAAMIGYLGFKLYKKHGPDNPFNVNPQASKTLGA